MAFFPQFQQPIGAALTVLCTLFSAGVVEASLPDCSDAGAVKVGVANPDAHDDGEKLGNGFYRFKGKAACSLTLPFVADRIQTLKHAYGEFHTTQPGFTLNRHSQHPEQGNGDWIFTGEMHKKEPYKTWITYEHQFTGQKDLVFKAKALALRGEGDGKALKAENVEFSLTWVANFDEGKSLWRLTFEREVQVDVPGPGRMFVGEAWRRIRKSIKGSILELATNLHELAANP